MFSFLCPLLLSNTLGLKLSFIQLTFSLCPCEQTTNSLDYIVANSSLGVEAELWSFLLWNTLVSYLTNLPPRYKYLLRPYQKMRLPCWSIKESCDNFCKKGNSDEDVTFPWLLPVSSLRRQGGAGAGAGASGLRVDPAEAGAAASGTKGGPSRGRGRGSGFGRV